jgi:transposase
MAKERKGYPSDVSDEEWEFCAPYLTLMKADAPPRKHSLRDLFNGLRWFLRAGCPWGDDAQRPAALAGGAATDRTLAGGQVF